MAIVQVIPKVIPKKCFGYVVIAKFEQTILKKHFDAPLF